MLKILQARLQQYMNHELPDVQAGFRKDRSTHQIANIHWIIKKAREFQKNIYLFPLYWLCESLWLCGSQQTMENSERDGNTRPPDLTLENTVYRSGSNNWNWTWNNRLVPNKKRNISGLYIAYLTYMQSSTSWETLGWMKHKLESRLPGEISITSDTHMTPPIWQKAKKN